MKKILLFLLLALPFSMFGQSWTERLGDLFQPSTSIEDLGFSGKDLGEYRDLYRKHKDDIDKILGDKSTSRREKASKMRDFKNQRSGTPSTPAKAKGKVQTHPGGGQGTQARAPQGGGSSDPRPASTRTSQPKPKSKASQLPSGGGSQETRTREESETRPAAPTRTQESRPPSKVRRLG